MRQLFDLLRRFKRDDRGVFAVFFAIIAVVLIATAGAVVDFTGLQTARSETQTALDAAALALQPTIGTTGVTTATLKVSAQKLVAERMPDNLVTVTVTSAAVDLSNSRLTLSASVSRPTVFVRMVGFNSLSSNLIAEVTQGSKNVEVAVALDTTGSMAGTKIADLRAATKELITLVVQDTQTPTYSKMAIIPWSDAADVGTYAEKVRGKPIDPTNISGATWISSGPFTITTVSNSSRASVTTSAVNGLAVGDYVYISGVKGMTDINNRIYKVSEIRSTVRFRIQYTNGNDVDSSDWNSFASGGSPRVSKCLNSSCQVLVTTSAAHGHAAGDTVYITGVGGMTGLNGTHVTAVGTVPNPTSYYLTDETAAMVSYNTYSGGGSSYCTLYGCIYYYFAALNGHTPYKVNTCATERSVNAFTDAAPSTTLLSFNYTSGGATCESQTIQPLTSDKTILNDIADHLTDQNSTAGHLGLAWGWYMISPNFASIWPPASQPAAYGKANLVKAVILMTDGEFNEQYCNGVLTDDIGCPSLNGTSLVQAKALCDAIKAPANNTILYTVGFQVNSASKTFLQNCATEVADFYNATTGADLTSAFQKIAQNLNELRISK